MKYELYSDLKFTEDFSVIEFLSFGKNGPIPKRITLEPTELENVYNLTLGNIDENGELDDRKVSDNGDRNKILATIFYIADIYTRKYPERWIVFRGNTKERTRLYRMAIGINLGELSEKFEIYAFAQNELIPFVKNMEINTFLIKRKII